MFVQETLRPFFDLPEGNQEEFERFLAARINYLVGNDFPSLVNILYRIDVSELKVKQVLKDHPDADAGSLIAALIIERMLAKAQSRDNFRPNSPIPDDEKW
ncbi:hypothetical protein EV199_3941 [Pseudobacter ginsenosidimutans]|uniref:Uncharacterized protein n=2 Tax=Pseudobacter ginsenosidimutans TaxID=661488 RepID=A0A4Q7MT53_9BACT|nr:hypothetical protein EV199_3941 [Pseudobacter ginsenosidimutans]